MRFIFCLFLLLLTAPAYAQNAPVAPSLPDWKSIGTGLADDRKPMNDRYVYMNGEASDRNIALDKAILTQSDIRDWINENLAQILTLDGRIYDRQVYENRLVFTPSGYADYIIYLKGANFSQFLKGNQYKVTAFVEGAPKTLSEGVQTVPGKAPTYHWQASAILILSYLDYRNQPPAALFPDASKGKIDNRLPIQANIELVRIPAQENGSIIAIDHLSIVTPETPAGTESLDRTQDGL